MNDLQHRFAELSRESAILRTKQVTKQLDFLQACVGPLAAVPGGNMAGNSSLGETSC